MFGLFAGLWRCMFTKSQYQILILGLDEAGKTTLLEQLKYVHSVSNDRGAKGFLGACKTFATCGQLSSYSSTSSSSSAASYAAAPSSSVISKLQSTVGLNIGRIETPAARLVLWDVGGQSALRVIWDRYYTDAHAIIYVIDASETGHQRLAEARNELAAVMSHRHLAEAPVLLLANKGDKASALSAAQLSQEMDLASLTSGHRPRQIRVDAISAITGAGVLESIGWLLGAMSRSPRTQRIGTEYV